MINRPKRRKSKDNSYTLGYDEDKNTYTVSFITENNSYHLVSISKEVFEQLDKFELEDLSMMNEYDNHIEHSKIYEEKLYSRSANKLISIEELVEKRILYKKLYTTIDELPAIQKRRLVKYYFYHKTFEDIAKEEGCTKRAVKFSVDIAIEKISKKFKI